MRVLSKTFSYILADFNASLRLWEKAAGMGALVSVLFAAIVVLVGWWGFEVKVDPFAKNFWTLFIGAWFLILVLIVTPFRMWSEQLDQIRMLEHYKVPKIEISDPMQYFVPWLEEKRGNHAERHFSITVTNISNGQITECSVQEDSFKNTMGHVAPERGRYFRSKNERKANSQEHEFERSFNLRGKGDSRDIQICSFDERQDDARVTMCYATKPTDQQKDSIHVSMFPHILTVRVTANELAQPEYKTFKISVKNGTLEMESNSNPS
ncbi:MAG: hypothetical protein WEC00_03750 [Dongiaceae bacterium]